MRTTGGFCGLVAVLVLCGLSRAISGACELTFGDAEIAADGTGWVELNWQCGQSLAGFQFDVSGMSLSGLSGGLCEEYGWSLNHDADTALCFTANANDIPAQSLPSHLVTLDIVVSGDVLSFAESVIFAQADGTVIDVDWSDTLPLDDCPADVYPPDGGDGHIGVDEVLALLGDWGAPGSPFDIDGDGTVGVNDLLAVLEAWGVCQ